MIKLVSVDDRLLHGQVAFYWTEYLKLNKIIVLNDEAANDEFTKTVLGLAKPKGIDLVILEVNDGLKLVETEVDSKNSVLVITGNLFDASRYLEYFANTETINVCGLRDRPNCRHLTERVALTSEDVSIIAKLLSKGIQICVQGVPKDKPIAITQEILDSL